MSIPNHPWPRCYDARTSGTGFSPANIILLRGSMLLAQPPLVQRCCKQLRVKKPRVPWNKIKFTCDFKMTLASFWRSFCLCYALHQPRSSSKKKQSALSMTLARTKSKKKVSICWKYMSHLSSSQTHRDCSAMMESWPGGPAPLPASSHAHRPAAQRKCQIDVPHRPWPPDRSLNRPKAPKLQRQKHLQWIQEPHQPSSLTSRSLMFVERVFCILFNICCYNICCRCQSHVIGSLVDWS